MQAQRAQAASRLNLLRANEAQIQRALDTLDGNVHSQQAAVAAAWQAARAAESALSDARRKEAQKAAEVDALRERAKQMAVDAYTGSRSAALLGALQSGSIAEVANRRELLDLAMGQSTETLDRLKAAREDLEAERHAAEQAQAQAAARKTQVEARLTGLRQAQRQQVQFADEVESKIAATTAESTRLAGIDQQLAAEIARRQAAINAAARASRSGSLRGAGGISLTSVRGIVVSTSIAGQLERMLSAADADGMSFSGSGYRDPSQQVALRRAHCGSSEYAFRSRARSLAAIGSVACVRCPGTRAPPAPLPGIVPSVLRAPHILRLATPAFTLEEQIRAGTAGPNAEQARTDEPPTVRRHAIACFLEFASALVFDDADLVLNHTADNTASPPLGPTSSHACRR